MFIVPLLNFLIFSHESKGVVYVNKKIDADFLKTEKGNILLYFGYLGCIDVCTPFLQKLSLLYDSNDFKELKGETAIYFVNLTPEVEPELVHRFAQFFNKDFYGVYLSKKELFSLDRNFALFFADDLGDATQINHTDNLYLIKNDNGVKKLKAIYSIHPLRDKKLIDDIISQSKE